MTDVLITGPNIDPQAWIAPGASVVGQVRLGPEVSIWYGCVLRGDVNAITIGARSNLQDVTVVHPAGDHPVVIGEQVAVGHRVIVHGCTVEDRVLVGMGAIVLNGARIGTGSIVGAGALVTQGTTIPPNSLVLGSPGKVVRETTAGERERTLLNTETYVALLRRHRAAGPESPTRAT